MKPAYEIVRITDIRPGDIVKVSNLDVYPVFTVASVKVNGKGSLCYEIKPEFGYSVHKMYFSDEGCIYRQLPPERNPEVLMRALEIACIDKDDNLFHEYCIELAIRELEREAGNVHG